jgi:hypothetical protein
MRGRILAKWSTTFSRSGPLRSIRLYCFVTFAELGISVRIPHPAPIPSATRKHPAIIAPSLSMVFQDRNTDSSQTMNNTIKIQASVFIPSPLWKTISPTKTFSLCPKSHRSVYAHQFYGFPDRRSSVTSPAWLFPPPSTARVERQSPLPEDPGSPESPPCS